MLQNEWDAIRTHALPADAHQRATGICVISIDNSRFSTAFFRRLAREILPHFETFWFFVADDLMVYNKYLTLEEARRFNAVEASYLQERRLQIEKVLAADPPKAEVSVRSYGDVIDRDFVRFFRKFLVLFDSDPELSARVEAHAVAFTAKRGAELSPQARQAMLRSSMAYIVEESAWTVYLAATQRVTDNFYPGAISVLIREFYSSPRFSDYLGLLGLPPHVHRIWDLTPDPALWSQGLHCETFGCRFHETAGG